MRIEEAQFQKGKIKKPAGAIYKALVEKYLLEDYTVASKPRSGIKKEAAKTTERKLEVAFRISEVREMYANPGPYAQRQ
ncbi:hypothetical protein [Hymenobacter wooponensis]|uniref:Uncharacterized protein n=1 Tax=Hymenobacter wooponensis TaxID=1525360 RepID=A0A4Z0MEI7_9BACT|nr:hypothetical protein [Hymenobacter wooponensis]TGD77625.1 hypothetical protein EU557_22890 [Hymenobacter wooponensis]